VHFDTRLPETMSAYSHLILVYTITWATCNILLLFSNKALLTVYNFKFPVTLTLLHMVAATISTALTHNLHSIKEDTRLSFKQVIGVSVLGISFGAGILLGNASLLYIPISFEQAIGASTPGFVAVFNSIFLKK